MKVESTPVAVRRAGPPRAGTAASGDRFESVGSPVPPADPRALVRQQRDQLLHSLLGQAPGLAACSPSEARQLCHNLDRVDSGILRWLSQAGVAFVVLHEGDDLTQSKLLRQQSLQQWETQLPAWRALGDQLHQARCAAQDFAPQILEAPLSMFRPRPDGPLGPRLTTLEAVALHHGASTSEEKQLFYQLVSRLNGDRLSQAQEENSSRLQSLGFEREPQHIPIDPLGHTLIFPQLYFCGPPEGRRLWLDQHDQQTLETWHNGGAKVDFGKREGDEWNGQYLYLGDQKRVLVRNTVLADKTPIHELGHVVDMQLEAEDPEFYAPFKEQLSLAYNRSRSQSGTVSSYAMANLREYFAEGFAHYYLDPQALSKKDPALNELVESACQRACQRGGIDLKTGREVRQQLAQLPTQLEQSLAQLEGSPAETRAQLERVSSTLKGTPAQAKTAQQTALLAVSYGLMAGAADGLLRLSLAQARSGDVDVEQAATRAAWGGSVEEAFQAAYQLSAYLSA